MGVSAKILLSKKVNDVLKRRTNKELFNGPDFLCRIKRYRLGIQYVNFSFLTPGERKETQYY